MDALDILHYGDVEVQRGFDGLTAEQWHRVGVTTGWSPRDLLAHLASYELLLGDVLQTIAGGDAATPTLDAMRSDRAHFNDAQVAQRSGRAPEEILREYDAAHARVMQLAQALGAERLRTPGTIPWYGERYALDDFIVYANYAHKREHCGQMKQFRQRA